MSIPIPDKRYHPLFAGLMVLAVMLLINPFAWPLQGDREGLFALAMLIGSMWGVDKRWKFIAGLFCLGGSISLSALHHPCAKNIFEELC